MQLSIAQTKDGALVIDVQEKRLDAAVALSFKDAMRSAADHPGSPVILGLSKIEFMDSSGLGAIVGVMKLLGADRPLELACLTPGVAKVFRLTRMDTVFRIHAALPATDALSAAQ